MRKLLVLAVAILLGVPAVGLAQAPSFGLRGGLNLADFGGKRIVKSDFRTGFTVGAFASVPISAAVSIQPEVVYSQRGARSAAYDYHDIPADGDAPPIGVYLSEKSRHDYLEVPVLLKLSPSPAGDLVRPVFFAGPSVGFLLGAEEVHDTDYEEYLNSTDFGVIIGGGVELGRLSLDARYNLGLAAIARDYDGSFGHVPGDVENRAFTVMVGLRLF
jgi:hypothetical protein